MLYNNINSSILILNPLSRICAPFTSLYCGGAAGREPYYYLYKEDRTRVVECPTFNGKVLVQIHVFSINKYFYGVLNYG